MFVRVDFREGEKIMSNKKCVAPEYEKRAFNCPHCDVYAYQDWNNTMAQIPIEEWEKSGVAAIEDEVRYQYVPNSKVAFCCNCKKASIWVNQKRVFPNFSTAPLPADDMPENVTEIYNKARSIADMSPEAACSLLRLAVQLLIKHLGEDESNLNKAIGNLVKKGLSARVQKALDSVRITGNHTIHPGEIDLDDNPEIANILFGIINFIVEKMITENKKIDEFYKFLPEKDKFAVNKRDNRLSGDTELAH